MRRVLVVGIAAALAAIVLSTGTIRSADAAWCGFQAHSPLLGKFHSSIKGEAHAVKKSRACKRAKRRCIRKLRRAWSKGQAQTFGCIKLVQAR